MKRFTDYLKEKNYKEGSIKTIKIMVKHYQKKSSTVPDYIHYCREKGNKNSSIRQKRQALKLYYDYLIHIGEEKKNPLDLIELKGREYRLPHDLLEREQLNQLYEAQTKSLAQKRNQLLLGLIIYQGLTVSHLGKLNKSCINLRKGSIYVPSGMRHNSRSLPLKALQILELNDYLENYDDLFVSGISLGNRMSKLSSKLRKEFYFYRNLRQIRNSVLVLWLKTYNLRQVQIMAGHKYLSSTEHYLLGNIERLQKRVEEYHPLNRSK